jgi:hypothetical protein
MSASTDATNPHELLSVRQHTDQKGILTDALLLDFVLLP